jgi:DNA-binding transcriptional ArsR family regulator
MNSLTSDSLNTTFAALADPTRRAILARLASGEASVTELAEPFAMSQPAISKHLKVLERAGLISRGRDAQRRPRRIEARPLAEATEWLEAYRRLWEGNFRRLDALLGQLRTDQHNTDQHSTDQPKVSEHRIAGPKTKTTHKTRRRIKRVPTRNRKGEYR